MNTKEEIIKLRNQSKSYEEIANILNVPVGTVKSVCHRVNNDSVTDKCLFCGSPLVHTAGKKKKKFCSDECRHNYWRYNRNLLNKKANYSITCSCCGKTFISYGNKKRKYCSRECYLKLRYGESHE